MGDDRLVAAVVVGVGEGIDRRKGGNRTRGVGIYKHEKPLGNRSGGERE